MNTLAIAQTLMTGATLALVLLLARRLKAMSVTAEQAQQDLDNIVASIVQLVPKVGQTLNDLVTIIGKQNATIASLGGSQMDTSKVEADVAAIQAQLTALGAAETNAEPADTILNPPAGGSSGTPTP